MARSPSGSSVATFAAAIAALAAVAALQAVPATARGDDASRSAGVSVIGGQTAPIAEYPWMARIQYESAVEPLICSGTVVAPRIVLTAAHCIEGLSSDTLAPVSTYRVITGIAAESKAAEAGVSAVSQVAVYPQFEEHKIHGDAGILILSEPVAAPPIRLAAPGESALWAGGSRLEAAGWGMTERGVEIAADSFHVGATQALSRRGCERRRGPFYSPAFQLCATGAPSFQNIACLGDSGGPAIARDPNGNPVEVGIFSLVGRDCDPHYPSVYTRVDRISGWVGSWIAAVEAGGPTPALREQDASLPYLTFERVEEIFAFGELAEELPRELRGVTAKPFDCTRRSGARVGCKVEWVSGGTYFHGRVAAYFLLRGDEALWGIRYTIRSERRACLDRPSPATGCEERTFSGAQQAG